MTERRIDRAARALVDGIFSPIYIITGVLVYQWQGWSGVIALCAGSLLYGVGVFAWHAYQVRKAVRA